MDTFDAIYQRRAIKGFDAAHRLTQEEETKLLEALVALAGSARQAREDPALRSLQRRRGVERVAGAHG